MIGNDWGVINTAWKIERALIDLQRSSAAECQESFLNQLSLIDFDNLGYNSGSNNSARHNLGQYESGRHPLWAAPPECREYWV